MKRIVSAFIIGFISLQGLQAQPPDTLAMINALIKKMTLEEKVNMVHASSSFTSGGVPRLGIPELVSSDGPHGVRPEHGRDWTLDNNVADSGTYLPVGVCLAATWNPSLGLAYGKVLGAEARFRGKDVILGPGINIIRTALNGRNFEYQSEDPFLISKMVVGYIRGVQSQGVSACVKHYAANNNELWRHTVDVHMSERALREIYLPGFRAAVQEAGVNTIMASYNKFRGQWASQSHYLLNQILKKEWGFRGIAMSDWDAVNNTMQAYWNGMDLEMGTDLHMLPNPDYGKFYLGDTLTALIKSGRAHEYILDDKVRRILYVMYKSGMFSKNRPRGAYNTEGHRQSVLQIAREGMVLLKNSAMPGESRSLLPLDRASVKSIAVIGHNAVRKQSMGGGSSQVRAYYEITPLEGLKELSSKHARISFQQGYEIFRGSQANDSLIREAAAAAAKADVAIVVGGWTHGFDYSVWADNAYDAEDFDKPDMHMPFGQDALIRAVMKANPRTIVVLMGGGPIDMCAWVEEAPAILQTWYAGMEGGRALAGILYGDVNPSGKLPMTFPRKLEDEPAHALGEYPRDTTLLHYYDDIYVGYRYYDTWNVEPQFAFGHGLSYTEFTYGNLKVVPNGKGATVTFTVKNSGKKAGAEVAQLYIAPQNPLLPRPRKELKGFEKIFLQPGETRQVRILLGEDAFQYYNDVQNAWKRDAGRYGIQIGSSSRDIRLKGEMVLR